MFSIEPYIAKRTGLLVVLAEKLLDLVTNFTVGELDIVLGGAVFVHKGKEAVVDVELQKSIKVFRHFIPF